MDKCPKCNTVNKEIYWQNYDDVWVCCYCYSDWPINKIIKLRNKQDAKEQSSK